MCFGFSFIISEKSLKYNKSLSISRLIALILILLIAVIVIFFANNTNKLKEICESLNVKSHLIETIDDLNNISFYDNIKIGITAGSSTPNKLVNEIIKSLEDDEYISLLTNKDLIDF